MLSCMPEAVVSESQRLNADDAALMVVARAHQSVMSGNAWKAIDEVLFCLF